MLICDRSQNAVQPTTAYQVLENNPTSPPAFSPFPVPSSFRPTTRKKKYKVVDFFTIFSVSPPPPETQHKGGG